MIVVYEREYRRTARECDNGIMIFYLRIRLRYVRLLEKTLVYQQLSSGPDPDG